MAEFWWTGTYLSLGAWIGPICVCWLHCHNDHVNLSSTHNELELSESLNTLRHASTSRLLWQCCSNRSLVRVEEILDGLLVCGRETICCLDPFTSSSSSGNSGSDRTAHLAMRAPIKTSWGLKHPSLYIVRDYTTGIASIASHFLQRNNLQWHPWFPGVPLLGGYRYVDHLPHNLLLRRSKTELGQEDGQHHLYILLHPSVIIDADLRTK
jgi:hypothetical protein